MVIEKNNIKKILMEDEDTPQNLQQLSKERNLKEIFFNKVLVV